jgi:flagellar protein FliL
MSDEAKAGDEGAPKKKKGKLGKLLVFGIGGLLLIGGGVGAGFYAAGMGFGSAQAKEDPNIPKLVPRKGAEVSDADKPKPGQAPNPAKYQASYYTMDQPFTSNLRDSDGLAQVALGVSTFYDSRVLDAFKDNEMPIRSAILEVMADQDAFVLETPEGKTMLRRQLKTAINDTLQKRTGFGGIDDVYFTSFIIQ